MIKLKVYAYGERSGNKYFPEQPEVVLINKRFIISARKDTITMPDESIKDVFEVYLVEPVFPNDNFRLHNILYATNKELEEGFDS